MARPKKDKRLLMDVDLRIPVTAEQKRQVVKAAKLDGYDLASWVRPIIIRAAQERLGHGSKANGQAV